MGEWEVLRCLPSVWVRATRAEFPLWGSHHTLATTLRWGKVGGVFTGNRTRVCEYPAQRADHYTMNSAQRASTQCADILLCVIMSYLGIVGTCLRGTALLFLHSGCCR